MEFPKQVEIVNQRLSILYYVFMGAMCIFTGAMFFFFEQYAKQVSLAGHVQVNMWPVGFAGDAAAQNMLQTSIRNLQQPICRMPSDYDFWWDENYKYVNHTCLPLCTRGAPEECARFIDTFIVEGADKVFLTTSFQKTFIPNVLDSTTIQSENYIVPTTEALGIGFAYSYDVPLDGTLLVSTPEPHSGSSSENVLTVLVDAQKKPFRAIRPSRRSVQLMVPDLLSMAGDRASLDSLGNHPNVMPNARKATGPLTRISGKTLILEINCYNGHRGDIDSLLDEDWHGPACYVGVRDRNRWYTWTSVERRVPGRDAAGNEGTEHFLYHGLRVIAKGDGYWKVIDVNNIYLNVVSFMVLLGYPKMFVLFIAVTLLGHYSKIYRGVIYEKFSIVDEVAGMATRIMSNSVAFVDLKDTVSETGAGISRRRMGERLGEALKHRHEKIDSTEMDSFVNFCYRAVATTAPKKSQHSSRRLLGLCCSGDTGSSHKEDPQDHINIDSFSKACSSLDKIRFEAVVKLFDRDRRVRFFERLFMPQYMKKYFSDVDDARSSKATLDLEIDAPRCSLSDVSIHLEQSLAPSVRHSHRASEFSNLSRSSSLGFEKAGEVSRLDEGSSTTASASSGLVGRQPSMPRMPSTELCRLLVQHCDVCYQASAGRDLTVEQEKHLPKFMMLALGDVITRALSLNEKLRDDERKIDEIQSQIMETTQGSTHLLDEMNVIGKQVKDQALGQEQLKNKFAERSQELEEAKSELGKMHSQFELLLALEKKVATLQQELGCTREETQSCKQELAALKEKSGYVCQASDNHVADTNILIASNNAGADDSGCYARKYGGGMRVLSACLMRKTPPGAQSLNP